MALLDVFARKKLATAVPTATAGLSSPNPFVRQHSLDALKQIGGQTSIDALATLLDSPDIETRRQAVTALGTMKARSAIPRLIPLVNQPETHDDAISGTGPDG